MRNRQQSHGVARDCRNRSVVGVRGVLRWAPGCPDCMYEMDLLAGINSLGGATGEAGALFAELHEIA